MKTLGVIGHVLGAGGNLLLDAVRDLGDRSLTLNEDRILEPAYLNQLLNNHALQPGTDARINSVNRRPIRIESSNCRNMIVDIQQDHGATPLPSSLYIKMPEHILATRWFFNVINAWALECHFCRHIAPRIPFRTPASHAVAEKGSRFILVQENLASDPAVTLHTNRDMQKGPGLEITQRCLDTFARLHAKFADCSPGECEQILPMHMHLFLSEPMQSVSQALNRMSLGPCLRKHPDVMPAHLQQAYRDTLRHWQQVIGWWYGGPLTLLHGDSHLGNFFEDGDTMGMLDFQAVHWGKGMRDVQYFLINSLPADTLADNERDLLEYYCERRGIWGSPLDFDTAWLQYRGLSFHTLMTIVVSIGLDAMTERTQLMEEILRRAVAACERLDYSEWLRKLLDDNLSPPGPA